jgi:ketosteroid isomerase-like protein
MDRILLPMLLALSLLGSGASRASDAAPDGAELTELLNYFLDGASRNDPKAHERFWSDDLVYTRSAGVRVGKEEILDAVREERESPDEPPVTYSAENIRVQQYGDTAVVAFRLVGRTGTAEKPELSHFLNTGTFVRRNGEWRAVAWQATRETEPEPPGSAQDAPVNLTPGAVARPGLAEEIRAADAAFFKAFFDDCDIATVRGYLTDDFEMLHDKSGIVATSAAEFVKATEDKCQRQADGTDFLSTRKLLPDTLEVYPINNYGAIASGKHEFFAVKAGAPDRLTETGRFTLVWKEVNGRWKLARALSFDHVLAP